MHCSSEEFLSVPSERSVSGFGLFVDTVEVDSSYWVKLSWSPTAAVKFVTGSKIYHLSYEKFLHPALIIRCTGVLSPQCPKHLSPKDSSEKILEISNLNFLGMSCICQNSIILKPKLCN